MIDLRLIFYNNIFKNYHYRFLSTIRDNSRRSNYRSKGLYLIETESYKCRKIISVRIKLLRVDRTHTKANPIYNCISEYRNEKEMVKCVKF